MLKLDANRKNYEDLPDEEWRSLRNIGFPAYWVSNKGRVRRYNKLRKLKVNDGGYEELNLYNSYRSKTITVHRLVLSAFDKFMPASIHVNHKDFNKRNNCLENLEWCTSKENVKHYLDAGNNREKNI